MQMYTLLSVPQIPTHRGEAGAQDSTIDLTWANLAASVNGTFSSVSVSWEDSFISDHTLIQLSMWSHHSIHLP